MGTGGGVVSLCVTILQASLGWSLLLCLGALSHLLESMGLVAHTGCKMGSGQ